MVFVAPLLYCVLRNWAAEDVRHDTALILLYLVMGIAWAGLGVSVFGWLDLHAREDVLERGNTAAAIALGGGILGVTCCFAGANIGDGPGWGTVLFCAALSTTSFFLAWLVLGQRGGLAEAITVDRDVAMGWRSGGFFVATGLVLGRSVAGNWVSVEATAVDFLRHAWWPMLVLLVVALALQRNSAVVTDRGIRSTVVVGIIPAMLFVAIGAGTVWLMGKW